MADFQDYADRFLTVETPTPQASWWSGAKAAFAEGWEWTGASSIARTSELYDAGHGGYVPDLASEMVSPEDIPTVATEAQRRAAMPRVSNEQARNMAMEAGVEVDFGDSSYTEDAATIMVDRAVQRKKRAEAIQSSEISTVSQIALGLGAGILDPVNLVAAFLPIAPAAMVSRIGTATTLTGRVGARVAVGTLEGAGGAALVEPFTAIAATQEGQDYGVADFLTNIAFGAGAGAVLRPAAGGIKDVWDARLNRSLPQADNIASRLDSQTYQEAFQAELSHMVDETPMRASEVIDRKASSEARSAVPTVEKRTYTLSEVARQINHALNVNGKPGKEGGAGSSGRADIAVLLNDYLPGMTRSKLQPFLDQLLRERGLGVEKGAIFRRKLSPEEKEQRTLALLETRTNEIRNKIAERFPNVAKNGMFYLHHMASHFGEIEVGKKAFIRHINKMVDDGRARIIAEEKPNAEKSLKLGPQYFDDKDKTASTLIHFLEPAAPPARKAPEMSVTVEIPARVPDTLASRVKLSDAIRRGGPDIRDPLARQEWWITRLKARTARKKKTEAELEEDAHTTRMMEEAGVKPGMRHVNAARQIVQYERDIVEAERITADLEGDSKFLDELIGGEFRDRDLPPEILGELQAERAAINEQLDADTRDIDALKACIIGE